MLEYTNHDQKWMKHLKGLFLEKTFDSDNIYTIPTKPKSAFFCREIVVSLSVQLELKKGYFEITNEELLMIN